MTPARIAAQQEPVANFGSAYVNENGVHVTTILGPVAIPQDAKLYIAPQGMDANRIAALEACAKALDDLITLRLAMAKPCGADFYLQLHVATEKAWHKAIAAVERLEDTTDEH